jgi:hypothetical protein
MSDESESYTVQIEGQGLSFTRKIDAPTLGRVMNAMLGGIETPLSNPMASGVREEESVGIERKLSLREFLQEAGAKRYPDKIVAIGHYLEEIEANPGFTKDDIKARFRTAGEPPPGNFPRDFSAAVGLGWIAEDPTNPGQLYVTRSGREAIEQGFSNAPPATRRRNVRRRRAPASTYQTA